MYGKLSLCICRSPECEKLTWRQLVEGRRFTKSNTVTIAQTFRWNLWENRKDNTWLRVSGFMIFIWYLEITQYVTITPLLPFRSIALMEQTWFHFAIFPNQNQHSEGLYESRPNKLARLEHAKSHRNYIGVGSLKSDVGSYLASDQSNKKWWCHRCSPILTIPIVHIMCWMALQLNSRPLWCHFNCTTSQEASIPQHRRAELKENQLIIENKLNIF